jgi:hypothetical protein
MSTIAVIEVTALPATTVEALSEAPVVVEVVDVGLQGPPGPAGPQGAPGPEGPPGPQGEPGSDAIGDVVGPATSVDNSVALYSGVTGKLLKDGSQTLSIDTDGFVRLASAAGWVILDLAAGQPWAGQLWVGGSLVVPNADDAYGSRYLRSTVSVSSPEIDSSRSTTTFESARVDRRASEISASGLPMSGDRPKFVARLARVGPATLCGPSRERNTLQNCPDCPDCSSATSHLPHLYVRAVRADQECFSPAA